MANAGVAGCFSLTRLSLCLGLAFGGGAVWAQVSALEASSAVQPATTLKEVVVSGSRVEQDIDEVPATITTISAERIANESPADLEELLKGEVGVSVRALPMRASLAGANTGRGGNEGVNIRGLEGDQVRLQVDGVSLPLSYSNGPYATGRGDTIDPEGYKRVEILRGSSGTQYGSDGLAGAVSFVTKDPSDLLTLGGATQVNIKTGYSSTDGSYQFSPSAAFKGETVQGMVLTSSRRGEEASNMGANESLSAALRTAPSPASNRSDYALVKLVLTPNRAHQLKITAESLKRENNTDVKALTGSVVKLDAREDISRDLLKLDYRFAPTGTWFDILSASLYSQSSLNRQYGYERSSAAPVRRTRDLQYGEDTIGGTVQLETYVGKRIPQRLVYGVDVAVADVSNFNDGFNSSGTVFAPNRRSPVTDYRTMGAFLQDEMNFGTITVTPGIRYDSFKLTPKPDAYYRVSNTVEPLESSGSAVSPKLGAIWNLAPMASIFSQYARGFRAPKPSQVFGGTTNLAQNYRSIGNQDLKPETSDSVELGIRGRDDTRQYSLSIFQGQYKDFIAQATSVDGGGVTVFQNVNLSKVDIRGFEARGELVVAKNWNVSAAYAHSEGEQIENGVKSALASIDPDKLILGLGYKSGSVWGVNTQLTVVDRKQGTFLSGSPATSKIAVSENFAVMDLSGWYAFGKRTRLNASIANLFDKKYVEWADVRDLVATSTIIDAYTQPGRNFKISLTHSF